MEKGNEVNVLVNLIVMIVVGLKKKMQKSDPGLLVVLDIPYRGIWFETDSTATVQQIFNIKPGIKLEF